MKKLVNAGAGGRTILHAATIKRLAVVVKTACWASLTPFVSTKHTLEIAYPWPVYLLDE